MDNHIYKPATKLVIDNSSRFIDSFATMIPAVQRMNVSFIPDLTRTILDSAISFLDLWNTNIMHKREIKFRKEITIELIALEDRKIKAWQAMEQQRLSDQFQLEVYKYNRAVELFYKTISTDVDIEIHKLENNLHVSLHQIDTLLQQNIEIIKQAEKIALERVVREYNLAMEKIKSDERIHRAEIDSDHRLMRVQQKRNFQEAEKYDELKKKIEDKMLDGKRITDDEKWLYDKFLKMQLCLLQGKNHIQAQLFTLGSEGEF